MSWFTSALDAVGINKNTATDLYKGAGGEQLITEVQKGVKEACKQGAVVGIKDYALPLVAGTTLVISGLIGIGYVIGNYSAKRK